MCKYNNIKFKDLEIGSQLLRMTMKEFALRSIRFLCKVSALNRVGCKERQSIQRLKAAKGYKRQQKAKMAAKG